MAEWGLIVIHSPFVEHLGWFCFFPLQCSLTPQVGLWGFFGHFFLNYLLPFLFLPCGISSQQRVPCGSLHLAGTSLVLSFAPRVSFLDVWDSHGERSDLDFPLPPARLRH